MNNKKDLIDRLTFVIECYSGLTDDDFEEVWYTTVCESEAIIEAYNYLNYKPYRMVKMIEYTSLRTVAIFYR